MTVLVTYASKHGGTEGIADALASRLRERGLDVDERPVDEVASDGYDAIVLGSGVYMGSWMKEAIAFTERSRDALANVPLWLFSSGPITPKEGDALSAKHAAELDALHPRDHRVFGGVVDLSKLGFVEKRIVRMVRAPEADHRDWDDIRAYADEIADALASIHVP
jgi:menaquinone-dependent protoporphyrinogen oxidase